MKERTCILIKPDGFRKKAVGKIIERMEKEGFKLIALKMVPINQKKLELFYKEHKEKLFYKKFMSFMCSGPMIASVWEGKNIIVKSRKVIGATDPKEAENGTLRNLYGTDNRKNLVHGSDSDPSAQREIKIMFKPFELSS